MLIYMSHDWCFFYWINNFLYSHACTGRKQGLISLLGRERTWKSDDSIEICCGYTIISPKISHLWAIVFKLYDCEVKSVIFKISRVLARSPINPRNIEQVPWPWNNNILICQVTRRLNCVWVEHILTPKSFRWVTLMTRKNQSCSKRDYFITIRRRFY